MKETAKMPLEILASILVDNHVFPNQTIMYRTLIVLTAYEIRINGQKQRYTTDDLIPQIQKYLQVTNEGGNTDEFDHLHEKVGNILVNGDFHLNKKVENWENMLSLEGKDSLRSNINHILTGKRNISNEWLTEYERNSSAVGVIIRRLFWVLQYYIYFYKYNQEHFYRNQDNHRMASDEYIFMSSYLKEKILSELKAGCSEHSNILNEIQEKDFNIRSFCRIIFEIIYSHSRIYKQRKYIEKLGNTKEEVRVKKTKNHISQRAEYDEKVDIYDNATIDWLAVCRKYASHNFFAAYKLGSVYYTGGTFYAGKSNSIKIETDYMKAMEYYKLSVELSNPPYPRACWAIGYMLCEDVCYGNISNKDVAYKLGMDYYDLAGEYAPAYNSKAKMLLKETRENRENLSYDAVVLRYAEAMCMAKKAADMGWLYGNNVIANFILEQIGKQEEGLLQDVEERVPFRENFDAVYFLKKSADMGNPWGMYKLAIEYLAVNKRESAKRLLHKACSLNYYAAYCTLAIEFETGDRCREQLEDAAEHECALAVYEIAKRYVEDVEKRKKMLYQAMEMVYAQHYVDVLLLDKIMDELNAFQVR